LQNEQLVTDCLPSLRVTVVAVRLPVVAVRLRRVCSILWENPYGRGPLCASLYLFSSTLHTLRIILSRNNSNVHISSSADEPQVDVHASDHGENTLLF